MLGCLQSSKFTKACTCELSFKYPCSNSDQILKMSVGLYKQLYLNVVVDIVIHIFTDVGKKIQFFAGFSL